jgi:hypothetical protein
MKKTKYHFFVDHFAFLDLYLKPQTQLNTDLVQVRYIVFSLLLKNVQVFFFFRSVTVLSKICQSLQMPRNRFLLYIFFEGLTASKFKILHNA